MTSTRKLLYTALLAAAALPADAHAWDAKALMAAHVTPARLEAVRARVEAVRAASPGVFAAVADFESGFENLYARRRGRGVPVARYMKALGPEAAAPALARLAGIAPLGANLSTEAREALAEGLIDALGRLRDPETLPVLAAYLDVPERKLARVAALAVGRIATPEAVDALAARLRPGAEVGIWAAAGLGQSHRLVAAQLLVAEARRARVGQALPLDYQGAVLEALGQVGNAWAWQTPVVAKAGEGEAVRELAARAIAGWLPVLHDALWAKASDALMLIAWPGTPAFLHEAGAALPAGKRAALETLHRRFAQNPVR